MAKTPSNRSEALRTEKKKIEQLIRQLTDRIIETNIPSVITTYETRINELVRQRIVIEKTLVNEFKPRRTFDESFGTALEFLANSRQLWSYERLEDKRAVLKLSAKQAEQRGHPLRKACSNAMVISDER